MKEIALTQNLKALVDDEEYDALVKHNWCAHKQRRTYYAVRRNPETGGLIKMHQDILGRRKGCEIDHQDGNGLNNQKGNLRFLTHAQNLMNSKKRDGLYSSRYKGVSFDGKRNLWGAYIWFNKKRQFLGRHISELEAALAYDLAAMTLYGDVARLNLSYCE